MRKIKYKHTRIGILIHGKFIRKVLVKIGNLHPKLDRKGMRFYAESTVRVLVRVCVRWQKNFNLCETSVRHEEKIVHSGGL